MRKWVKVRVPASTSNLGSGFDVFGLALKLYNEALLEAEPSGTGRLRVQIDGEGLDALPWDERNLIWKAALKAFARLKFPWNRFNFRLAAKNRIPLARGLGSSAAAAVSGIMIADGIAGGKLSQKEILELAVDFEGHPDNVAPQVFGGLCVALGQDGETQVIRLNPPRNVAAVVCVPDFELSTQKARAALPKVVAHKDAVFGVSRAAAFLGAVFTGKPAMFRAAMEDRLHQPYRKKLVPGFDKILARAYRAGAYGAALSGAGPSIFALAPPGKARRVGREMEKGFAAAGAGARSLELAFDLKGAERVLR